jgi:hypothetical protein
VSCGKIAAAVAVMAGLATPGGQRLPRQLRLRLAQLLMQPRPPRRRRLQPRRNPAPPTVVGGPSDLQVEIEAGVRICFPSPQRSLPTYWTDRRCFDLSY